MALLSVLLAGSAERALADDNQPRILLPEADFSGNGISGTAWITPENPYFTVFLWWMNEDKDDTNWVDDPYLKVDGHELHLWGLSDFSKKAWECYNSSTGEVYFYVRARDSFRAGNNETFQAEFSDLKKKSHWDDDHYIPLDIYIPHNTLGAQHNVSAHGKFHSDEGVSGKDYDDREAKDLKDQTVVTSGKTSIPIDFEEDLAKAGSYLRWTEPGILTFKSNKFTEKDWGLYDVSFGGVCSERVKRDSVFVTKDPA